ncbi:MAG: hypothetical protein NT049_07940, partial [Planctomycetota bacterium]|nr:hypothetical protein [Planctomycetota bacterium]
MADATLLTPGAQPVAATQQLLPYAEQDAARRTISEEMRKVRQAAIAGHEQAMAETAALGVQPPAPAATSNAGDPSAMPASPGAMPPDTATPAPAAGAPCAPRQALSYVEQDAARRAISVDMRKERQALIAAGQGQAMAEATPSAGAPSAMPAPAAGESAANGQAEPRPVMSYRDQDAARRALSEEMRKVRQVAMANAQVQQAAETPALTATQRQTLKDFVTVADGISRALAADDCKQFNEHMARLPVVLPALQKELAVSPHWAAPVQRLAAFGGEAKPAKDLDEARRQFLPLSTATVDLVKQLRKEDSAFSDLKIYHCPMAPKPGLWMQAQGPLRNPFYGSQMLTCGDEVKP